MAQSNAGAVGANGAAPQLEGAAVADGAVPLVNGAVVPQPQMNGARVRGTAPVAGPLITPVAGLHLPQGLARARFDVDGALLGPLPTKSNGSCKILPKIADETGP